MHEEHACRATLTLFGHRQRALIQLPSAVLTDRLNCIDCHED